MWKVKEHKDKGYMTLTHMGIIQNKGKVLQAYIVTFMAFQIIPQSQFSVCHLLTCDILSF